MRFLSNAHPQDHLKEILFNLDNCEEAKVAVAFLKSSGLSKIIRSITHLLERGGACNIVAGQNFAFTEPSALHKLRELSQKYPKNSVYLANAAGQTCIFHPKLYLFKCKQNCVIVSGSANITEGGLLTNTECSLSINCDESSTIWNDVNSFFNNLLLPGNSELATLLTIKKYEVFYEQQKQFNKRTKAVPTLRKSEKDFNYGNLQKHFLTFDNKKRERNFEEKSFHYTEAEKVLDNIADYPNLTRQAFEPLLDSLVSSTGEYWCWHSGSLFRLRRKVYPFYKEFQEMVRWLRQHKYRSPAYVYEWAKGMVCNIEGASVNYITEIMMTYNQSSFANLNKNPITVLRKEGGLNIKANSESFTASDYSEYCDLVEEINNHLGLRNMLESDSFFNTIYWKIKK